MFEDIQEYYSISALEETGRKRQGLLKPESVKEYKDIQKHPSINGLEESSTAKGRTH